MIFMINIGHLNIFYLNFQLVEYIFSLMISIMHKLVYRKNKGKPKLMQSEIFHMLFKAFIFVVNLAIANKSL
jgi:hypothetical protein